MRRGVVSTAELEISISAGALVSRQVGDDSLSASGSRLTNLVDVLDDSVLCLENALALGLVVDGDGARKLEDGLRL